MSKPIATAALALMALASIGCSSLTRTEEFRVKKDTAVEAEPAPAALPAAPGNMPTPGRPAQPPGKGG